MKASEMIREIAFVALLAIAIAATAAALARGDIYVITPGGVWRSAVTDSPQPWVRVATFEESDTVVITEGGPPGNGNDDDGDNDSELITKLREISKQYLRSVAEATAIRGAVRSATNKASLMIGVRTAKTFFSGNQFDRWLIEVNLLSPADYTPAFLRAVDEALTKQFGLQARERK